MGDMNLHLHYLTYEEYLERLKMLPSPVGRVSLALLAQAPDSQAVRLFIVESLTKIMLREHFKK